MTDAELFQWRRDQRQFTLIHLRALLRRNPRKWAHLEEWRDRLTRTEGL